MKRKLLASLFIVLFAIAITQAQYNTSVDHRDVAVKVEYKKPVDNIAGFVATPAMTNTTDAVAVNETIIGMTQYDLQSNTLLSNRIHMYPDGTIGAVWTRGMTATAFPDRGTGYNYFDGTTWGPEPSDRIESLRTGWPSYAPLGADGELVVSHDFGANELIYLSRDVKGMGNWNENTYTYTNGPASLSWNRTATNGNTIHMIANSFGAYMGMNDAVVYSRSLDAGLTWDTENIILDGMDDSYYFELGPDDYVWAEPQNGQIAFLVGGAWNDLFMMKSDDDGDNWEKTVIWEHPYPFFDWEVTITDTFFCVDNSASICLDNSGKAHVAFGINRVIHPETGTSYFLYPYVDGIGYWNEDMATFSNDLDALAPPQYGYANSEMVEDVNYIGWMQDVDGSGAIELNSEIMFYRELGPSTMPTVMVDDNDDVFVLFASTTETYVNDVYNYKHLWGRAFSDGVWGEFLDLTSNIIHIFDEAIYPVMAQFSSDANIHYIYNADVTPGTALDEEHGYQDNRMIYGQLPKSELLPPIGINEVDISQNIMQLSQNFPNPVQRSTRITITLEKSSNLNLEVTNLLGQIVINNKLGEFDAGSHEVSFNMEDLEAGIYFYTINDGNSRITKRLIKE